jgi:hypothetical protein
VIAGVHDMCRIQRLGHRLAGQVLVTQVDQDQVIVRPAGDKIKPVAHEFLRQSLGIGNHLRRILGKLRRRRLAQRDRQRRDRMHMRPALKAGKDRLISL